MFLQTTHPFRVGDRVSLRFDCKEQQVHIRAAEVMWVRPFEPISVDGSVPGVGLKFVALDPPSRAALRRFVAPHLMDTTLPEMRADDDGMALPPPSSSLPPITGSIVMKTTGKQQITDEMIAISIPPFTEPPICEVFANTRPMGTPAPITIGPRRTSMKAVSLPPHPLMGWTFRKEEDDDAPVLTNEPVSEPFIEDTSVTIVNQSTLDMRFDDEGPKSTMASLPPDEARLFDVWSTPPTPAATQIPDEDAIIAVESAVMSGDLAIRHLPIVEERRASPKVKAKSRALPIAFALLCAGTLVGVVVGSVVRPRSKAPTVAVAPQAVVTPAIAPAITPPAIAPIAPPAAETIAPVDVVAGARSVADVERDLTPASVVAPKVEAPMFAIEKTALPRKERAPEPTFTASAPKSARVADKRTIEVRVGDARVVKAFVLGSPSRVVVDLAGAKLPKAPLLPGDGIRRVRFGNPVAGTSRVVVELDQTEKANGVETWVSRGVLTVTFR